MKRLFTICVLTIVVMGLRGQSLPVVIAGNVYNNGLMKSIGPVHLLANSKEDAAKVDNDVNGTLEVDDSIIFYSNASYDGLLMNKNTAANAVQAAKVVVRKTFDQSEWYQVSFPFAVNFGSVTTTTGAPLTYWKDFGVQTYNAQNRANIGKNDSTSWQYYTPSLLPKGMACRIAIDDGYLYNSDPNIKVPDLTNFPNGPTVFPYTMDFPANTTNGDIPALFANTIKGVSLTYARSAVPFTYNQSNSEGWNAFGGLNSTDYAISGSTVGYNTEPIYYWDDFAGAYSQINLQDSGAEGILRPYAVIWVHKMDGDNLSFVSGSTTGGFAYNGTGVTLNPDMDHPVENPLIFRSSSSADNDLIKVVLSDVKSSAISNVYFEFNKSYNQVFKVSEGDRIVLDTQSKTAPIVWAFAENEFDATKRENAFIDCLPYNNNEVPLGVNIPAAGDYVFSLKNVTVATDLIKSVILKDNNNKVETELLTSDYPFHADAAANTDNRFVLFINKSMTSIDEVAAAEIYAYAENNILTVKNVNTGDKVQILDVTGRIVASGIASSNTYSAQVNQKGVYIVNVRGEKTLKVLNK